MPSNAILEQKAKVVADLAALIKASASGVIVNYQGITVEKDTAMRKALREAGVKYMVVKNTMTGRACEECGYGALKANLNGMTAIAISESDPIAPARRSSPSRFLPDTWTVRCWTPTVSRNWRQFLQRKC